MESRKSPIEKKLVGEFFHWQQASKPTRHETVYLAKAVYREYVTIKDKRKHEYKIYGHILTVTAKYLKVSIDTIPGLLF